MNLAYLKRGTLRKETVIVLSSTTRKPRLRRRTMSPQEKKLFLYKKFITFKQLVYQKLKQTHSPHYVTFNKNNYYQKELIKMSLIGKGPTFYQQYKINSLVMNRATHYNCIFKDNKILNHTEDFLTKYFYLKKCISFIKQISNIEQKFLPVLFPHGLLINTYLDKHNEYIIKYNEKVIEKNLNTLKGNTNNNNKSGRRQSTRRYTFRELVKAGFDLINNNDNKIKHSVASDSFASSVEESNCLSSLVNESNVETASSNISIDLDSYNKKDIYLIRKRNDTKRGEKEESSIELIEKLIDIMEKLEEDRTLCNQKSKYGEKYVIASENDKSSFDNDNLMITSLKYKSSNQTFDMNLKTKQQDQAIKTSRFQSPRKTFKYVPQSLFKESQTIDNRHYKSIEEFVGIQRYNNSVCFKKGSVLSEILKNYSMGISKQFVKNSLQDRIPLRNKSIIKNLLKNNNYTYYNSVSDLSRSNRNFGTNSSNYSLRKRCGKTKSELISEKLFRAVSSKHLSRKGEVLNKGQLDLVIIGKTERLLNNTQKRLNQEDMKLLRNNSWKTMISGSFLYKHTPRSYCKYV